LGTHFNPAYDGILHVLSLVHALPKNLSEGKTLKGLSGMNMHSNQETAMSRSEPPDYQDRKSLIRPPAAHIKDGLRQDACYAFSPDCVGATATISYSEKRFM
jgi:hypothetical protein